MVIPSSAKSVMRYAVILLIIAWIIGGLMILFGIARFGSGGFFLVAQGAMVILGGLAFYGLVECFMASVSAQIDIRNALVNRNE